MIYLFLLLIKINKATAITIKTPEIIIAMSPVFGAIANSAAAVFSFNVTNNINASIIFKNLFIGFLFRNFYKILGDR